MGRKEGPIEEYLVEQLQLHRATVRKTVYQGRKGALDRQAFFPGGRLLIVEAKAPGEWLAEPDQAREAKLLRVTGFYVACVNTTAMVDEVIRGFLTLSLRQFNEAFPLDKPGSDRPRRTVSRPPRKAPPAWEG